MTIRKVSNVVIENWSGLDKAAHSLQRQIDALEDELRRASFGGGGGGAGEVNTASNVGVGGVGPYNAKVGVDLQFRNINTASARLSVVLDAPNNEIDLDVVQAQIDHGSIGGLADSADHAWALLIDGTRPLTAAWDAGAWQIRAETFQSDVAAPAAPLVIASNVMVTNLNADLLDGQHAAAFAAVAHLHDTQTLLLDGVNSNGGAFAFDTTGAVTFSNTVALTTCVNAGVDTDKFLVLDAGDRIDFRTGAEVLSDIGGVGFHQQIVTVAKAGAQFTTVQGAIDSILDNTTNKRYAVVISPGVYTENVVMKEYVSLVGRGGHEVTEITSVAGTTLTCPPGASDASIENIKLSSAPTANGAIVLAMTAGEVDIYNCYIEQASATNGIVGTLIAHSGGELFLQNCKLKYDFSGTAAGVGTHALVDVTGTGKYDFFQCHWEIEVADTNDSLMVMRETGAANITEAMVKDCVFHVNMSHAAYSGIGALFYILGLGTEKALENNHVHCETAGNGTFYGMYINSAGGGEIHTTANRVLIEGFTNNIGIQVAAGDLVSSHLDDVVADGGNAGAGTIEYASSFADGDFGASGTITGESLVSTIATGTAPLVVASTTLNTNLNADLLDGNHAAAFQPIDAFLTSIGLLGTAADRMVYTTGVDVAAETAITAFGRSLVDDADAATAQATLGLVIGTNVQAYDAWLTSIALLGTAADRMIYATGVDTAAETVLTAFARTILDDADAATVLTTIGGADLASLAGLDPGAGDVGKVVAVSAANTYTLAAGAAPAAHDILSLSHGDTLAAAVSQGSLVYGNGTPKWAELVIGGAGTLLRSDGADVAWASLATAGIQPLDATLTSLALLGTAADKMAYATGVDTWAETALTAFARTILDDADQATVQATLAVVPGTNVQVYDAWLTSIALLGTAADKMIYATGVDTAAETALTAFARTILDDANQAAVQATLALVPGTNVQAYDATLLSIAALGTAADKLAYTTGVDTWAETVLTAFGRSLIDDANAAAGLATLGASASTHLHDTQTLEHDAVNSDGGAFAFTTSGTLTFSNTTALTTCINAAADVDKFLVLDAGNRVDYRTGAEVLSDIGGAAAGAAPTAHTHDGDTLQLDEINSNGGAFPFTTSDDITFVKTLVIDADSEGVTVGAAQDAGHTYDGTNWIFDSQLVGTGDYHFLNGDIFVSGGALGVGRTPIYDVDAYDAAAECIVASTSNSSAHDGAFLALNDNSEIVALKMWGTTAAGSLYGQLKTDLADLSSYHTPLAIGTQAADNLYFGTNDTLALTIDTSQDASFAGLVTAAGRITGKAGGIATPAFALTGALTNGWYLDGSDWAYTQGGVKVAEFNGTGLTVVVGGGGLTIPDAGYIGSASDTDAIQIAAGGDVTFSQDVIFAGNVTIVAPNGTNAQLELWADNGDDLIDKWKFLASQGDGDLHFQNGSNDPCVFFTATGQIHADLGGGTGSVTVFDDYDDPKELSTILREQNLARGLEMGIYSKTGDKWHMNLNNMAKLTAGGVYQNRDMIERLVERIEQLERAA